MDLANIFIVWGADFTISSLSCLSFTVTCYLSPCFGSWGYAHWNFIFLRELWGLGIRYILSERTWAALGSSQKHQGGKPLHSVLSLSLSFVPPDYCLPFLPVTFPSSLSPSSLTSLFLFHTDRLSSRPMSYEGQPWFAPLLV